MEYRLGTNLNMPQLLAIANLNFSWFRFLQAKSRTYTSQLTIYTLKEHALKKIRALCLCVSSLLNIGSTDGGFEAKRLACGMQLSKMKSSMSHHKYAYRRRSRGAVRWGKERHGIWPCRQTLPPHQRQSCMLSICQPQRSLTLERAR